MALDVTYTSPVVVPGASSYTFPGVALGAAAIDRVVLVMFSGFPSDANGLSGVTIGGVAATKLAGTTNGDGSLQTEQIWVAVVPTGTTGDIVLASGDTIEEFSIVVARLTGVQLPPTQIIRLPFSYANDAVAEVTVPTGGVAVLMGSIYDHTADGGPSWQNATQIAQSAVHAGQGIRLRVASRTTAGVATAGLLNSAYSGVSLIATVFAPPTVSGDNIAVTHPSVTFAPQLVRERDSVGITRAAPVLTGRLVAVEDTVVTVTAASLHLAGQDVVIPDGTTEMITPRAFLTLTPRNVGERDAATVTPAAPALTGRTVTVTDASGLTCDVVAATGVVNLDTDSYTWTGVQLGAEASDRLIVVEVCGWALSKTIASVTIGGVAAAPLVRHVAGDNSDVSLGLFAASLPDGTTADITVSFGDYTNEASLIVTRLTGAKPAAWATAKAPWVWTADQASVSLNVPPGGVAILTGHAYNDAPSGGPVWTNATQKAASSVYPMQGTLHSVATTTTPGDLTVTLGNAVGSGAALVGASFEPAVAGPDTVVISKGQVSLSPKIVSVAGSGTSVVEAFLAPYGLDYADQGAEFAQWESDYVTYIEQHQADDGSAYLGGGTINGEGGGNYYDRAAIYYLMWARKGTAAYKTRADALVANFRDQYIVPNNYFIQQHWWITRGLALDWLINGSVASRTAVGRLADWAASAYSVELLSNVNHPDGCDQRIAGYTLSNLVDAYIIDAPSSAGNNWLTRCREFLNYILAAQLQSGTYAGAFSYPTTDRGSDFVPFMHGLLIEKLIRYYNYVEPDPRIPGAVKKCVDFLWNQAWNSHGAEGTNSFTYVLFENVWGELPEPAPDLNMLCVEGFGFVYHHFGLPEYITRGDQVWAGRSKGADIARPNSKQFNQSYTNSYNYPYYRTAATLAGDTAITAAAATLAAQAVVEREAVTVTFDGLDLVPQAVTVSDPETVQSRAVTLTGGTVTALDIIETVPVTAGALLLTGRVVLLAGQQESEILEVTATGYTLTGQDVAVYGGATQTTTVTPAAPVLTGQSILVSGGLTPTPGHRGGGGGGPGSDRAYRAARRREERRRRQDENLERSLRGLPPLPDIAEDDTEQPQAAAAEPVQADAPAPEPDLPPLPEPTLEDMIQALLAYADAPPDGPASFMPVRAGFDPVDDEEAALLLGEVAQVDPDTFA